MPGLLELGPMTAEVAVMGQPLTLHPLSVDSVIKLFSEFPQLIMLVTDDKNARAKAMSEIGPRALASVVACATGELDNPAAVDAANRLGLGKIAEILDKVMEITFEDGVGPFVKRLMKRTGDLNQLNSSETPSSVPLSGALVGDAQRPIAEQLRRAKSASGSTASTETKQPEQHNSP